jgi:DNA polymerase-3 subunit delta'
VPAGKEVIQSYLQTEKGLSSEEARIIAAYSNGNIGRALKLQSDEEFREKRNTIIGLTRQLLDGKISELLERVGFFNDEKDSIEDIFDIFVCWYRDLLIFRETQQFDFIMNCDKIEEIRQQSKTINSHKAREIILIIEKNKSNMRSNVNFQLNIEVMLLNIQEVLAW